MRRHSFSAHTLSWLTLVVSLSGCQMVPFSGGGLSGPEAQTDSFAFADDFSLMVLEVNPAEPYSVNLRVTVIDGALYVDAAERRRWHDLLKQDPRVRVKLGDTIYPATAAVVEDADIVDRFFSGRIVYRLDPMPR